MRHPKDRSALGQNSTWCTLSLSLLSMILISACAPSKVSYSSLSSLTGQGNSASQALSDPNAAPSMVLTQHNDNQRTGANLNESILNVQNVNAAQFGKVFTRPVQGHIYAQPLYVSALTMPDNSSHNVVFVATEGNNVYAFDADDPAQNTPLWQVNLGPSLKLPVIGCGQPGAEPLECDFGRGPNGMYGDYHDIKNQVGITSTPVIDMSTQTMYVVSFDHPDQKTFRHFLHALDLTTGAEKYSGPMQIKASAPGTGPGSVNGVETFESRRQLQRSGLLLHNDMIVMAFASYADTPNYEGWVLAYDAKTLQQVAVFNTSPDSGYTGIWQSGNGLAVDPEGNIYGVAGNGEYTQSFGGNSLGDSAFKLGLSRTTGFQLMDWFTPNNYQFLNDADQDLGSSGILFSPSTGLGIFGSKEGKIYVVDRNHMGHLNGEGTGNLIANDGQIVQSFQATDASQNNHNIHGTPVAWNSDQGEYIYVWGEQDKLKAFKLISAASGFNPTPTSQSPETVTGGMPGGIVSLSSKGNLSGTGIVWATHAFSQDANSNTADGVVEAFDANDVSKLLWTSKQNIARDNIPTFAKFNPPTIAGGKVFVGTFSNQLVVFGLLSGNVPTTADFSAPVQTQQTGNRCITIPGSSQQMGATIVLGDCAQSAGQLLHYVSATGQLKMYSDSLCLTDLGAGHAIGLGACVAGAATQVFRVDTSTGTIIGNQGLCLDAAGRQSASGTPITLYACNGQDNQMWTVGASFTVPNPVPTPVPTPVPPPPVATTWTHCAYENGFCNFTGTQMVRYGVPGAYVTQTLTGGVACTNGVFGDPAVGVGKSCDYAAPATVPVPPPPVATTWTHCANENGFCAFTGTQMVRYGVPGAYVTQTLTGGVACTNGVFGDPAVGVGKSCDYAAPATVPVPPPPVATTWTNCANENGFCAFTGTQTIRYGVPGAYVTMTLTGGTACSNAVFGDPAVGAYKSCEISSAAPVMTPPVTPPTNVWTACANENATCVLTGTHTVRYGANGVFATKTVTGSVSCSNDIFGDPVVGVYKSCSYQ